MQRPFLALLVLSILAVPSSFALAQTPTAAQQQAIRSNCVSDYRANCSGVPTGGMEALVCLEKNVDNLSPSCKSAVEAVDSSAASASQDTASASGTDDSASTSAPRASDSSDAAKNATADTSETPSTTSSSASSTVTAAPAETANEPKLTFRQEMALAAGSCAVDFRLFCPNLPVGHGNILFCLRIHGPRLAPACHDALVKAGVTF
jgi:hypothetical protein